MEIILYAMGMMYSPGPVNFMGLNAGLTGHFKQTINFFIGVGCAIMALFIILGYIGEAIIPHRYLPYISLVGAVYTYYLAYQMVFPTITMEEEDATVSTQKRLTFWNGFLIQFLNPKGILLAFPIVAIMYPSAHITGINIALISCAISIGGGLAPGLYALAGDVIGKKIKNKIWIQRFTQLMGAMLIIVGSMMLYDFVIDSHLFQ